MNISVKYIIDALWYLFAIQSSFIVTLLVKLLNKNSNSAWQLYRPFTPETHSLHAFLNQVLETKDCPFFI